MNEVSGAARVADFALADTYELEDGLSDDLRARAKIMWVPEPKGGAIRIQALERGQFKNLVRIEYPDGSGALEFCGASGDVAFGYYHSFRFAGVPEVRRVEQIVRNNLMTSGQNV